MTIDERAALERIEAKVDGLDDRLRTVETAVGALTAVDAERVRQEDRSSVQVRWIVALAVSTGLSVAGLLWSVFRG